jgi:hypothetical protein
VSARWIDTQVDPYTLSKFNASNFDNISSSDKSCGQPYASRTGIIQFVMGELQSDSWGCLVEWS